MKTLINLLLLCVVANANAGLISFDLSNHGIINTGQQVTADIIVNNINMNVAELEFETLFDNTKFSFNAFSFSTAVNNSLPIIADSYLSIPESLNIYLLWLDSIDIPASNFTVGTITYTALIDASLELSEQLVFVGDVFGDLVANPQQVSEPAHLVLVLIAIWAFFRMKNTNH